MAKLEGSGGGHVGKLWRKHGGGYYALLAVGTFVLLEASNLVTSFRGSDGIGDFVSSEIIENIVTFGVRTVINTFLSGIWPLMWISWMGLTRTLAFAGGGYVLWALLLAWLLARREKELRSELGL